MLRGRGARVLMTPRAYIRAQLRLFAAGRQLAVQKASRRRSRSTPASEAPVALLFSPHPDDECLTGALALNLKRMHGWRVVNVAVTLGSRAARRRARLTELRAACARLAFELILPAPGGLTGIHPAARRERPAAWARAVARMGSILRRCRPMLVCLPHAADGHPTHAGVHWLVMDALRSMPAEFACRLAETEFWRPMRRPNLMLPVGETDAADLLAALLAHRGELRRNPYHRRWPAWLLDNARRGAELVGGAGAAAPEIPFAVLYRIGEWRRGRYRVAARPENYIQPFQR